MMRHVKYLSYVIRHKWFVLIEGLKIGAPIWQLILHDWSKFLPGEWIPYARTFRKPNGDPQYKPSQAFWCARNAHIKRHKHHWHYWITMLESGELMPLPMPDRYRREMLADWRAAGLARGEPDTRSWYVRNRNKIMLHPSTREWVERQLYVCEWHPDVEPLSS